MSQMVEMPGGPRIDHYYGRGVEGVERADSPNEDQSWSIILAGGVVIRNYDEEIPAPGNELGGMQMVGAVYSELETKLLFKLGSEKEETITLNPNKYSISDPNIVGGESFPQRPPEMADEEGAESDSEATGDEEAEEGEDG